MFLFCCTVTYLLIAWLVPKTYSSQLDRALDQRVEAFLQTLENTTYKKSGNLFDQFSLNSDITIWLYDAGGHEIPVPSQLDAAASDENSVAYESGNEDVSIAISGIDNNTVASTEKVYYFSFADSDERYCLTVVGGAQAINQVTETLGRILPWLVVAILSMSVICAAVYSRYVTKPVIQISSISQKMSDLKLDWKCKINRTDELGILAQGLNMLSSKLSGALTELQEANTQLQDDIDHEKKLEKARLAFFSAVSHDLKTPITVIKGQLEGMLLSIGRYRDRDKYLARALEVTNTLENMVKEILTVTCIESSDFALNQENFDLSEMVKNLSIDFEDMIVKKQLSWHENIDIDIMIYGDKLMLKKVLDNLVSNAIHYSPESNTVIVITKIVDGKVYFSIENTGIHISDDDISKLFDAFYRVEKSRNRQTGGSGLGLYIVKMILDQHKASYKIENSASGVCFTIRFG
jgi:two-component system sensor histidine kinase VanS